MNLADQTLVDRRGPLAVKPEEHRSEGQRLPNDALMRHRRWGRHIAMSGIGGNVGHGRERQASCGARAARRLHSREVDLHWVPLSWDCALLPLS